MQPLSLKAFNEQLPNALVLDFRLQDLFERSFIPGSLFCGLQAPQPYCLELIEKDRKLLLICPLNQEQDCITLLKNKGFNQVIGYLEGGINTWLQSNSPVDMIISITPEEFLADLPFLTETEHVLDIRTPEEHKEAALPNATLLPLSQITDLCHTLNTEHTYYIYCSGGYRSMIAASILRKRGFFALKNIYGGYARIVAEQKTKV